MSSKTHDKPNRCQEQVLSQASDQQWHEMLSLSPTDISQQARTHKAFLRSTGVRCPTDLLRGILAYVFCLGSFRQVGSWSSNIGLCTNGARSWAKRTRQAASWLLWIVQALLMPVPFSPEGGSRRPWLLQGGSIWSMRPLCAPGNAQEKVVACIVAMICWATASNRCCSPIIMWEMDCDISTGSQEISWSQTAPIAACKPSWSR